MTVRGRLGTTLNTGPPSRLSFCPAHYGRRVHKDIKALVLYQVPYPVGRMATLEEPTAGRFVIAQCDKARMGKHRRGGGVEDSICFS